MFRVIEGDVTLVDNEGNVLAVFENTDSGEKVLKVRIDDGYEDEEDGTNPPHVATLALKREHTLGEHHYNHLVTSGPRDDELLVNNIQMKDLLEELISINKKIYLLCSMIVGEEIKEDDLKL